MPTTTTTNKKTIAGEPASLRTHKPVLTTISPSTAATDEVDSESYELPLATGTRKYSLRVRAGKSKGSDPVRRTTTTTTNTTTPYRPDRSRQAEAKTATSTGRNRQPEELAEQVQRETCLQASTREMLKALQEQGIPIRIGRRYTGQGIQVLPEAHHYMDCDGKRYIGFSVR